MRRLCADIAQQNQYEWVKKVILGDEKNEKGYQSYLERIPYTWEEMEENERTGALVGAAVWGRPEIEGRMLCQFFGVRLHILDVHDQVIDGVQITETFVNADAPWSKESLKQEDYISPDLIHMVNHQNHYVPLLNNQPQEQLLQAPNISQETSVMRIVKS